ncbi:ABC transporter ATP-binding protein [Candidatus Woesearchaeota archaeon]|nr:ABC transporter ATP-binding protein [Candidatus Woesearchaeota archaeon]
MLQITHLQAGYGELQILQGIDLEVKADEIVALIGPNGAGKSTVLKSIFNITTITQGQIIFKGKNITGLPTYELLKLGVSFVPQGKINFGELTVQENLELGAGMRDKAIIQKNLERVYHQFPALRERKEQLAFSLSGGQQQMLALGRALMQSPSLLLLDEPSLGLSPKLQVELFQMLVKLKQEEGLSLLMVEQNAKKAIEIADRTYLLEDGKVALQGGKEILSHKKIKEVYLGGR